MQSTNVMANTYGLKDPLQLKQLPRQSPSEFLASSSHLFTGRMQSYYITLHYNLHYIKHYIA